MTPDLTYLSFGGGVQSTCMLAMCLADEHEVFPRPDVVIYADTQSESQETVDHVAFMKRYTEERGVRFDVVTAGSLERALLGDEQARVGASFLMSIPAYTSDPSGATDGGMLRRQCTRHYKVDEIQKHVRGLLGVSARGGSSELVGLKAEALIGISIDEAQRMRTANEPWLQNRYPLCDAKLTRQDCLKEIARRGLPEPRKSACVFCPYHDKTTWTRMKREQPAAFARAVKVDRAIRDLSRAGVRRPVFLHRSLKPLDEVDFEDKHQLRLFGDADGFGNECEGMCGV